MIDVLHSGKNYAKPLLGEMRFRQLLFIVLSLRTSRFFVLRTLREPCPAQKEVHAKNAKLPRKTR